jgi:hypothetical protein
MFEDPTFCLHICIFSLIHKFSTRVVLLFSWFTAFMGLHTLTQEPIPRIVFSLPLVLVYCVALMETTRTRRA